MVDDNHNRPEHNRDALIIERDDRGVVSLTLNRPETRNALDESLIRLFSQTLKSLKDDRRVRVVQIRGMGRHFSAGADLEWMRQAHHLGRKENYQDAMRLARLLKGIDSFPVPVITVVQGAAYGGALGLVAASDITLAADSSCFCFSEVRLGLIPAVISPYVIQAMGLRQARRYLLSAEQMSAGQALRLGLIHDYYPLEQLEEQVRLLTDSLLQAGPVAQKEAKSLLREVAGRMIDDDLMGLTAQRIGDIRVSDEAREGLAAFLEKRPPGWRSSL